MSTVAVFLNSQIEGAPYALRQTLDARKLTCFMLTLRTKKLLDEVGPGGVLKITTHDPGSVNEFTTYTKQTGNELIASSEANGEYVFYIRKK